MGTVNRAEKDKRIALSRCDDDRDSDVDHDLVRLLEENARLRTLVTQLYPKPGQTATF